VNGGGQYERYFISGGYDKDLSGSTGNGYSRATISANNTFYLLDKKFEVTTRINYINARSPQNGMTAIDVSTNPGQPVYPYAQFKGSEGANLALNHNIRNSVESDAFGKGLLDWSYRPLDELAAKDNVQSNIEYRINTALKYKILPTLSASLLYQYDRALNSSRNLQSVSSWYTRNLINTYTFIDNSGLLNTPVPNGAILDQTETNVSTHNVRAQLDFSHNGRRGSGFNMMAGAELNNSHTVGSAFRFYGYDPDHASNAVVDYVSQFDSYVNPVLSNQIPNRDGLSDLTDRFISYYSNAAYNYRGKYTLSASGRIDQSNLFGVNTNQKAVPLWSAGFMWNLSQESFYKVDWLPLLKPRITYGYNGNIDKSLSAYITAIYQSASNAQFGIPYAQVTNPPNPDLRWERVRIINIAADFASKNDVISGTIEYYRKSGFDLIGTSPLAPQTGVISFSGNTANTSGSGIEVTLNAHILDRGFKWYTTVLYSHITDKVSKYLQTSTDVPGYLSSGGNLPIVGKPLYAVYSYRWAGLDPQTGDPRGYLAGVVSKDYAAIIADAKFDNIQYNGPARPVDFGSWRNTFSFRSFTLSATLNYQLGYYVRREGINYNNVLSGYGGNGDYSSRWHKPGDELITQVPSMPEGVNTSRNDFYIYSSALVEKGDHINLQDINLSYEISRQQWAALPFRSIQIYLYANNISMIWKAAKGPLNPDYLTIYSLPPVRTVSLGLRATL
jgi:predicted outer membrane repeat protein